VLPRSRSGASRPASASVASRRSRASSSRRHSTCDRFKRSTCSTRWPAPMRSRPATRPTGPELAHLVRNVRRTTRPGAHEGVHRQVPRGFPVFSCRGGRRGPAVTGAVQPMRPAAGLPLRLRPGRTRRPSSACAAARPGPPRGHGSRRSGLRRRSRAPSAAAASASPTTRRGPSPRQWKQGGRLITPRL
jgi:hypothetical protein